MSADRQEEEYHLTPHGWLKGSQKVYDNETKTVSRPTNAVLTLIKESLSPSGIDPAEVSWREGWRSEKIAARTIQTLLKKHGDPRVFGERLDFRPSPLG